MSVRLAKLFAERDGRSALVAVLLGAAGIAVSTTLILLVISFAHGLGARGARTAWRAPADVARTDATAWQHHSVSVFEQQKIERIDLAPTGDADAVPTPPGLPRFPAAGEVWVSPALAELMGSRAPGELADRFPGSRAGVIAPEGLANHDELVVVVGHEPAALAVPDVAGSPPDGAPVSTAPDPNAAVPIAAFQTATVPAEYVTYQTTAMFAVVLLAVPAVLLIGSSARFTASRRSERFARLRLAGAKPASILQLAGLEAATVALVGTAAGILAFTMLLPSIAAVPINGGAWMVSDLWLGFPFLGLLLVAVPILAVISVVAGLRDVLAQPLGVARHIAPRPLANQRLLIAGSMWLVFLLAILVTRQSGGGMVLLLIASAGVIGSVAVVGPLVVRSVGRRMERHARRPGTLLASRRVLDDPKGAFRTVLGVALAGLLAGFLLTTVPTVRQSNVNAGEPRAANVLSGYVPDREGGDVEPGVRGALRPVDPDATITTESMSPGTLVTVSLSDPANLERARTALTVAMPHPSWTGSADLVAFSKAGNDDIELWSVLVLAIAMTLALCTITLSMLSSVHEQRETLARQHLAGMSLATMQRIRAWQAGLPMVVSTVGSMALGGALGCGLLLAFGRVSSLGFVTPSAWPLLALVLAAGLIGPVAARLTAPAVRQAVEAPLRNA